ncbi:substrate-binding domain-containing protein [Geobacter pelophilus]|uniref:Substrate-binding domain-containing protein n=1 Tax=Geoanaerobacter pelophilus TaxID=60036 RepID=A0AAW4L7S7_9BACT|nr:substrate-binding domain-containing protein [Geoanaerobacter pelophilus]MBT0665585.1 substrate-binding domain-containing protein [Geoanaerobacter pelophilus]
MLGNIRLIVAVVVLLGGLQTVEAADTIRINGSGSALDMLRPMISAYRKANPGVTIIMEKPLGSSGAVKALLAGVLDIVVSSKNLKPEETQQGAIAREYGRTPLLFVTNMDVKKDNFTLQELKEIYEGKMLSWPDGKPLRLVLRPEGDIDTKIIRGLAPAVDAAVTVAMKRHGMKVAITDPDLIETVAKTPGAVGATSLCTLLVLKPKLNPLALNGVKASTRNLSDGSYPAAKEIRFVTTAKSPLAATRFLDFVYSAKGRGIAEKSGVLLTAQTQAAK